MHSVKLQFEYAVFSAGQAAEISGVNPSLQRHWRRRGLLSDIPTGKHARFPPGEVLRMMIMKAFSDSNISIKGARIVTDMAKHMAWRFLESVPGAVEFVAEPSLGPDFIDRFRRLDDWFDVRRARYLFIPLPERQDGFGHIVLYYLEDLSDLHALLDEDGFHGLLMDCEAIARAFVARALRVHKGPITTWIFTRVPDGATG